MVRFQVNGNINCERDIDEAILEIRIIDSDRIYCIRKFQTQWLAYTKLVTESWLQAKIAISTYGELEALAGLKQHFRVGSMLLLPSKEWEEINYIFKFLKIHEQNKKAEPNVARKTSWCHVCQRDTFTYLRRDRLDSYTRCCTRCGKEKVAQEPKELSDVEKEIEKAIAHNDAARHEFPHHWINSKGETGHCKGEEAVDHVKAQQELYLEHQKRNAAHDILRELEKETSMSFSPAMFDTLVMVIYKGMKEWTVS